MLKVLKNEIKGITCTMTGMCPLYKNSLELQTGKKDHGLTRLTSQVVCQKKGI